MHACVLFVVACVPSKNVYVVSADSVFGVVIVGATAHVSFSGSLPSRVQRADFVSGELAE